MRGRWKHWGGFAERREGSFLRCLRRVFLQRGRGGQPSPFKKKPRDVVAQQRRHVGYQENHQDAGAGFEVELAGCVSWQARQGSGRIQCSGVVGRPPHRRPRSSRHTPDNPGGSWRPLDRVGGVPRRQTTRPRQLPSPLLISFQNALNENFSGHRALQDGQKRSTEKPNTCAHVPKSKRLATGRRTVIAH
jgi:hypothetical protein